MRRGLGRHRGRGGGNEKLYVYIKKEVKMTDNVKGEERKCVDKEEFGRRKEGRIVKGRSG